MCPPNSNQVVIVLVFSSLSSSTIHLLPKVSFLSCPNETERTVEQKKKMKDIGKEDSSNRHKSFTAIGLESK